MRSIRNTTRTSQPIEPSQLDWSNPILRAIDPIAVYAPVGNRMHEFVRGGSAMSYFGTNDGIQPNVRVSGNGPGGYTGNTTFTGALNGHWETGVFPNSSYRFLLVATTFLNITGGAAFATGIHDGTHRYYIGETAASTADVSLGWGSNAPVYTRKNVATAGQLDILAYDVDVGLTQRGYDRGHPLGSNTVSWSGGACSRNFYIGKRTDISASDTGHGTELGDSNLTHLVIMGRRAIPPAMHFSLGRNPWQIFSPTLRPGWAIDGTTIVSIVRASSDILTTGWTGNPDNTNKYANINEIVASDTEYVKSPTITTGDNIIFGLSNSLAAGTWDVTYRANFEGASAQVRVTLLDSSNVAQGTSGWQTVTSSFAAYTATITSTGVAVRVKVEVQ